MTAADRPPTPTEHRQAAKPAPEPGGPPPPPRDAPRGDAPAPDAEAGHEPGYGHGV